MNFSPRSCISWILLTVLWAQSFCPALFAATPIPPGPVCGPVESGEPFGGLPAMVESYLLARAENDLARSIVFLRRIRERVFSHIGTPAYQTDLETIDRFVTYNETDQSALYDLALSLQDTWEYNYGAKQRSGYLRRQQTLIKGSAVAGGAAGLAAGAVLAVVLGASALSRPQAVPQYFRILRQLLPLMGLAGGLGTMGGVAISHVEESTAIQDPDIPPSPAAFLHLGVVDDSNYQNDSDFEREILAASASLVVGSIPFVINAVRALRVANAAATPAKLHPLVLAGSIAASIVVEKGVLYGADRYSLRKLQSSLIAAVQGLDGLSKTSSPNEAAMILYADLVAKHGLELAFFIDRPIAEAHEEFLQEQQRIASEYKEGTREFEQETQEARDDFSGALKKLEIAGTYRLDPDYEAFAVRKALENDQDLSIWELSARTRAEAYRTIFRHSKLPDFKSFLREIDHQKWQSLSDELQGGLVRSTSSGVLLQTAASLAAAEHPYASEVLAIRLLNHIEQTEILVAQMRGRGTGTVINPRPEVFIP